jgi:hypothetical protein
MDNVPIDVHSNKLVGEPLSAALDHSIKIKTEEGTFFFFEVRF